MSRIIAAFAAFLMLAGAGPAQDPGGPARIDADRSRITDAWRGAVQIDLHLSHGVPYRLFTLADPPRIVLDFQEVDWAGLDRKTLLQGKRMTRVQFGAYVPGWSRMVGVLAGPMNVGTAAMAVDPASGAARLSVRLDPVSPEAFAAASGAPRDARWDLPLPVEIDPAPKREADGLLTVVLDPGHGGIDPGAETDLVDEKTLMLAFAREVQDVLRRSGGFHVVLTREDDRFVSLEARIAIAHQAGADVFLSLHADSLAEGQAHGATVHVLSRDASDAASAKLAERHDRTELLSGVDLSAADDQVTGVLLDLARQETQPRSEMLAKALVAGMAEAGGPMNTRPLRRAAFSVLKAADIPSALVEIGFLSSPRDLANLQDPEWRATMARGLRNGLQAWRAADDARRPLVRQ